MYSRIEEFSQIVQELGYGGYEDCGCVRLSSKESALLADGSCFSAVAVFLVIYFAYT